MEPADVARSYLESFATGDVELIARYVTDDFVNEQTASLGEGCRTRDVYRRRLVGFLTDMAGLTYEVEHLVSQADQVMVAYRMRARWKGESEIDIRGVQHLVMHDGLIAHRTDYWDSGTFLDQVNS